MALQPPANPGGGAVPQEQPGATFSPLCPAAAYLLVLMYNQLIFNGYMVERAVVYFDIAFLAPARKFFPKVRGSNWYYNKYDTSYCIPDG